MKQSILICIMLLGIVASAQKVLHDQTVEPTYPELRFAPNGQHSLQVIASLAYWVNTDGNGDFVFPSYNINFGGRYRCKLNAFLSLGSDVALGLSKFKMKELKDTSRSISSNNLLLQPFLRINLGRRGNILGRFVDLGAYARLNFCNVYKEEIDLNSKETLLYTKTGLENLEAVTYGLVARLGINRLSLLLNYRLSPLFKKEDTTPKLLIGLEISI